MWLHKQEHVNTQVIKELRRIPMKNKKILSLILVAGMVLSSLTGCGNANQKEKETSIGKTETQVVSSEVESSETEEKNEVTIPLKETMTFSGLALVVNHKYPLSDNVVWKYAQERANIKFELIEVDGSEAKEKGNLLLAGGDYPEFLWKMSTLELNEYGEKGVLIPLEDLIKEYAPNLCAKLDEVDGWNTITHSDGHVYALPYIGSRGVQGVGAYNFWINTKWLENVGMSIPTNMDDLYKVLKAFKEQDGNGNGVLNDEVPLSFKLSDSINMLLGYIGDGYHYLKENVTIVGDKIVFYPSTEGYYNYLEEMAKWYKEGLIDQEVFTRTSQQWAAMASAGDNVGVYFSNNVSDIHADYQSNYVALKPFAPENYPLNNGINKGGFAITDKCENPEVLMAWVDWLYTEEGGATARYGILDKDWKYTNNGKNYVADLRKNETKEFEHSSQYQLSGSGTYAAYVDEWFSAYPDPEVTPVSGIAAALRYAEGGIFTEGYTMPTIIFTQDEGEKLSVLKTDINGYVSTYTAQVVVGELSLKDSWEDFQKTLEAMGAKELERIYNEAYTRSVLKK